MKRIVTIQDISCLGKCSLTVALPVISALGVETSVLPTALLSAHTAFPDFTVRDLQADVRPILAHWKQAGVQFDAIYTGYLGSTLWMDLVSQCIDDLSKEDTLVFIDPVMGDHGTLYTGLAADLPQQMRKLCAKADVIAPNLTEACLLLDRPYLGEDYTEAEIQELLLALSQLAPRYVILTGISFEAGRVGAVCYDAQSQAMVSHFHPRAPERFHGTGDCFASACVGALTRGFSLEDAMTLALDFTYQSICCTLNDPERRWYSVNFEEALPLLYTHIQKQKGEQDL